MQPPSICNLDFGRISFEKGAHDEGKENVNRQTV